MLDMPKSNMVLSLHAGTSIFTNGGNADNLFLNCIEESLIGDEAQRCSSPMFVSWRLPPSNILFFFFFPVRSGRGFGADHATIHFGDHFGSLAGGREAAEI